MTRTILSYYFSLNHNTNISVISQADDYFSRVLFGGYFGGAEKRCTHWWLLRSFFFVVAPKFIFKGGGSKDPTQDWWLK